MTELVVGHIKYVVSIFLCILSCVSCQQRLPDAQDKHTLPELFPDYTEVTIPPNIAPLNFQLRDPAEAIAVFSHRQEQLQVKAKQGVFTIPYKPWKKLLERVAGDSITVTIYAKDSSQWYKYLPYPIYVSANLIDSWLVYRRIAPGYRMWSEMGIYQRCLEDFTEEAILENKQTNNSCINCHSFCMNNSQQMLFHQRANYAGTYLVSNNTVEKLNPEQTTDKKISSLVYPYWHPLGNYIAFSTNDTKQDFHLSDPNRIEVFDNHSDIVLYDLKKNELFSDPVLASDSSLEIYPAFSPDGRQLYFCSAVSQSMPELYREMKYSLVRTIFNPEDRSFGKVDTLYNAKEEGRSAKFPRISPDGNYLLYTLSDYGNFSIWHKDADLRMINLRTLETDSLPDVNSGDVESYHSWSSNSRWFVFSSRRMDGLYTRPYICYIDKHGKTGKPFVLPQKNTDYYTHSLFSFNIPELIKERVGISPYDLLQYILKQNVTPLQQEAQ